jgi:rod shape-determining protein MreB
MGFFDFFSQDLAIDLGTANTLIIHKEQVVVNEPSIIAINKKTGQVKAVGKLAQQMHGKTHEDIKTIRPLKDGVIADFEAAEQMLRGMISRINNGKRLYSPHIRMVICIPSGITEVEKRAVKDSAQKAGAREVYLIPEPMAAAIGIGIQVEDPIGNMVIDIGGGTTEIAVITLAGIACDQSIRIAGDEFTQDISEYIKRERGLKIGEPTAEKIKIEVGSALIELDNPPPDYLVSGSDIGTGIPKQISVSYSEIASALDKSIVKIEEAILRALDQTPAELASDIYNNGLYLTGGGALLRGLDKRIQMRTKLTVYVAEDPLKAVVRGTGLALKFLNKYKHIMS